MNTYFLLKKILIHTLLICFIFSMVSPASACQCGSKVDIVKANMHTFQTILETYAVDWGGAYPTDLNALEKYSKANNQWKDLLNPYTSTSGYGLSFARFKDWKTAVGYKYKVFKKEYLFGLRVLSGEYKTLETVEKKQPGLVLYKQLSLTAYRIYGTDENGLLIGDREKKFYLSNEE